MEFDDDWEKEKKEGKLYDGRKIGREKRKRRKRGDKNGKMRRTGQMAGVGGYTDQMRSGRKRKREKKRAETGDIVALALEDFEI